jgi:hypothetical protein
MVGNEKARNDKRKRKAIKFLLSKIHTSHSRYFTHIIKLSISVRTHHTAVLPHAPDNESATYVLKGKESNAVTHKKRKT